MNVMRDEFATLRRAGEPRVLDRILVDYYGTPTPIQQLGNIATPEPRILQISVWDVKAIKDIEKAIQKSDLGINPTNDGKVIRLVFPELTEERRRDLCKTVRKSGGEQGRHPPIRRDANEQIKKLEKGSEITEDDRKQFENEIQKITDGFIKDIDAPPRPRKRRSWRSDEGPFAARRAGAYNRRSDQAPGEAAGAVCKLRSQAAKRNNGPGWRPRAATAPKWERSDAVAAAADTAQRTPGAGGTAASMTVLRRTTIFEPF